MRAPHLPVVLSLLTAAAAPLGCTTGVSKARPNPGEAAPAVKVDVAAVEVRPMPRYLALTGSLAANRSSQVAADGMGRVRATFVERGAFVRQGDVLVRLDARSAALSQSEARAQVQALRSQQEAAQRECERAQKLLEGDAIGLAEYDRLSAQCSATGWSSEAASARAELASKALGDAVVRAPFSGMVVERFVSVGEYVRPGSGIATLVETDPLRLQLTVPESEIARVRAGQRVSFEVTAFPDERFEGEVVRLSPAVRAGSRDLIVEAEVQNAERKLLPGMFALAKVALEREPRPVIPQAALRGEGTRSRVFAVVDGRLEERLVQLGEREGDLVAVEKGLLAGERIASRAEDGLADGQRVQ